MDTVKELREVISSSSYQAYCTEVFFDRNPYIFPEGSVYSDFKALISSGFKVDPNGIKIVGSACLGFSINPYKIKDGKLKQFHTNSDIDIAVVSEHYFDIAWNMLLYNRRNISEYYYNEHKNRLIFNKTIATNWILNQLPFSNDWNKTLLSREISMIPAVQGRVLNTRVYRDEKALHSYLTHGLKSVCNTYGKPLA